MTPQTKNPGGQAGASVFNTNSNANYTTAEDNLGLLLSQLSKVNRLVTGRHIACCCGRYVW